MKREIINGHYCKLTLNDDWSCDLTYNNKTVVLTEESCGFEFKEKDFYRRVTRGYKSRMIKKPISHCKSMYYKAYIEFLTGIIPQYVPKPIRTLRNDNWLPAVYQGGLI